MSIFIIRLKPNMDKTNIDMEDKKRSSKIHHDFVESLVQKNIILFGGPVVEEAGGMIIANLPSKKAVLETFSEDPMVSKEYVSIKVLEWNIKHNLDNFNKLL